jgi:hypothetical protein
MPSNSEWKALIDYLIANEYNWDGSTSSDKVAKTLAASKYWQTYVGPGAIVNELDKNNCTGLALVPNGVRNSIGGYLLCMDINASRYNRIFY